MFIIARGKSGMVDFHSMKAIGIAGASGKFGRSIVAQTLCDPSLRLVCGVGSGHSPHLGQDLGTLAGKEEIGVALTCDYATLFEESDLIIDVSVVSNLENMLTCACQYRKPLVIGTTGHDEKNISLMQRAAKTIPLFYAANFSLGIAALTRAASMLCRMLDADFAIAETHHQHKKDRPSGTALRLAEAMKNACGREPSAIHSERKGEVIGEHAVVFSSENELITLHHSALSRTVFAKGAIIATKFLARQPAGFYSMDELLLEASNLCVM